MKTLTIMIGLIGALTTLSLSAEAAMKGIDLQNCRTQSGTTINPQLCEKLRISEARAAEREKSDRAWREDLARRRQQEVLQ
ncbi:MAG TPA: hypothetical protein VL051_03685, partial [Burkholderiaceae bacterium]|nr:hypothetical protein [Burkholderiaceae bacterium]